RNFQFLHHAPYRFPDPHDVVVCHLALDRRRVVRVHSKRRLRASIRHGVLGLRKQLVDVLERRAYVPLVILAKAICFDLVTHFFTSPLSPVSPTPSTLNTRMRLG